MWIREKKLFRLCLSQILYTEYFKNQSCFKNSWTPFLYIIWNRPQLPGRPQGDPSPQVTSSPWLVWKGKGRRWPFCPCSGWVQRPAVPRAQLCSPRADTNPVILGSGEKAQDGRQIGQRLLHCAWQAVVCPCWREWDAMGDRRGEGSIERGVWGYLSLFLNCK